MNSQRPMMGPGSLHRREMCHSLLYRQRRPGAEAPTAQGTARRRSVRRVNIARQRSLGPSGKNQPQVPFQLGDAQREIAVITLGP